MQTTAGIIEVASGKPFNVVDIDPAAIDINDIAHALAMKCRFNGHCKTFYSVAQHSVRCADYAKTLVSDPRSQFAFAALLHDAHEAYTADIPRPVQCLYPDHAEVCARVQQARLSRYLGKTRKPRF